MKLIFDASCLITAAKFKSGSRFVLDRIADTHQIIIPPQVKKETVADGLKQGYTDAVEIGRRVKKGLIMVKAISNKMPVLEKVLDDYGVESGDREVLLLAEDTADYDFLVTDDQMLYIIAHRLELKVSFLPDLICKITSLGTIQPEEALKILAAIKPRYRKGFIEHSIKRVEGVI